MHNVAYVLGVLLLLAAVIATGEMLTSGKPFDPVLPCALAVLGAGVFSIGLFMPFGPDPADQCSAGEFDDKPEGDDE